MFGESVNHCRFHLVLSVGEVVELVATTAMEKDKSHGIGNAPKRRVAKMVQDLRWQWSCALRSVSGDRGIQVHNGIPLHEQRCKTGEYRYIMGFHFMNKDANPSVNGPSYNRVADRDPSHSFTDLFLSNDQSDSSSEN